MAQTTPVKPAAGKPATSRPAAAKPVREKISPVLFFQQVRTETNKVTWPTRRETAITSVMVFLFVIFASVFFLIADFILKQGVGLLLGLGR